MKNRGQRYDGRQRDKSDRKPNRKSFSDDKKHSRSERFKNDKSGLEKPNKDSSRDSNKNSKSVYDYSFPKDWRAVVGLHSVREVLSVHPHEIKKAWFKPNWESSAELKELVEQLKYHHIDPEVRAESVLDSLASGHQGVCLWAHGAPQINLVELYQQPISTLVMLDGVEDPHNLGAVIRTSWLMEVDGILIPQDRAVGLTPTVHKVASGGVEHVPVDVCSSFQHKIEEYKKNGYWVYGLDSNGKNSVFDIKFPEKIVLAFGAEGRGLRTTTSKICDELIYIPQASAAASYNVSVAVAMTLAETYRQRKIKKRS